MSSDTGSLAPSSPQHLLSYHEARLHAAFEAGELIPIVLPYHLTGILIVVIYLLLPPSCSKLVRYCRVPAFAFYLYWCITCIQEVRTTVPHACYGIGIVGAWSVLWIAALMIWRDARNDCARIWPLDEASGALERPPTASAGSVPPDGQTRFYWQSLPIEFIPRVHWAADLGISMRGIGWNHASRFFPPPPRTVLSRLAGPLPPGSQSKHTTVRTFSNRDELIRHTLITMASCYLALDFLKTLTMQDPYFLGYVDHPSPFSNSWLVSRTYRSIATMSYIGISLQLIFALNPWFFAYVCGPDRFLSLSIRAEPWNYPGMYGSFSAVWRQGLRGFWGDWWHQIFRLGFSSPVEWFANAAGWDMAGKDKNKTKALGTVMAFGLSGLLHSAGSWTSFGETNPARPFLFFALQGVAVLLEAVVRRSAAKRGCMKGVPSRLKEIGTFAYVFCWLCATAPLLCDDFARSGVWLLEPVPLSLIRGLQGNGWLRWDWRVIWWHTDKAGRWWRSGIAFG